MKNLTQGSCAHCHNCDRRVHFVDVPSWLLKPVSSDSRAHGQATLSLYWTTEADKVLVRSISFRRTNLLYCCGSSDYPFPVDK